MLSGKSINLVLVCLAMALAPWAPSASANHQSALVGTVEMLGQPQADLSQAAITLENLGVTTRLDGQNRFRFEGLQPGQYAVHVTYQGIIAARREKIQVKMNEIRDIGTLFIRGSGAIAGNALLSDGSNHSGIEVRIPGTNVVTRTNADGSYQLQSVPAGIQSLWASKLGYMPVLVTGIEVQSGQTSAVADMILLPVPDTATATLMGHVKGITPNGPVPLEGAEVKLTAPNSAGNLATFTAETDENGAYQIDGIAPGAYTVEVEAEEDNYAKLQEPIFLGPGQILTKNFVLHYDNTPGTGLITGRVVENVGDLNLFSPIVGAEVSIQMNGALVSVLTNQDGKYEIASVIPGRYKVRASKPGYGPQEKDADVSADGRAVVDFQLIQTPAQPGCILGIVFEGNANINPTPLANADVWLYPPAAVPYGPPNSPLPPSPFHGKSGPNGSYQIDNVPPGSYLAIATKDNLISDRRPVNIPANQCINVDFFLHAGPPLESGRVEGVVTENTGMLNVWIPIPGALVTIVLPNGINLATHTNQAGEYHFPNVPMGSWLVQVAKMGYENQSKPVDVTAGETSVLNFQLVPLQLPKGNVAGNVTGATGGLEVPLEGAEVVLLPMFNSFPGGSPETQNYINNHPPDNADLRLKTQTDTDGNFTFSDIPIGPYMVGVHARGYFPGHERAVVEADATTTVNFILDPLTFGAIAGTVTEATDSKQNSGAPIAGALLTLVPSRRDDNNIPPPVPVINNLAPDGTEGLADSLAAALLDDLKVPNAFLTTTSAADGSYSFSQVPTGFWSVIARARGYFRDIKSATVAENTTSIVDFQLRPRPVPGKGIVEGHVWEYSDTDNPQQISIPIAGALVFLHPAGVGPDPADNDTNLQNSASEPQLRYGDVRPNSQSAGNASPRYAFKTITDENGFYQFLDVPEGRWVVQVAARGYRPERMPIFLNPGEVVVQDFYLHPIQPLIGALEGTVTEGVADPNTNPGQGAPIAGALVIVLPRQFGNALLDEDINVGDPLIPTAIEYNKPGDRDRSGYRSGDGPKDPRPSNNENGIPVPNCKNWKALTDENGHYRIENLPAGEYMVGCLARGFFPARQSAGVQAGQTTLVDFALSLHPEPRWGAVIGKVVGSAPASTVVDTRAARVEPIPGAVVMLIPVDDLDRTDLSKMNANAPDAPAGPRRQRLVTLTDDQGNYVFRGVPEGRYVAVAKAQGFNEQRQRVGVEAGGTAVANFRLEPLATGRVLGTVTAAPSGQPIEHAMLVLVPLGQNVNSAIRFTGPDGGYLFDRVKAGRYVLSVVARNHDGDAQVIEVEGGIDTIVDFALDPMTQASSMVFGRVFEVRGNAGPGLPTPIAGALVTLRSAGIDPTDPITIERTTTTDANGYYEFPNYPPNPCHLTVQARGYAPFATDFVLHPNERKQVDAYLRPIATDTGELVGQVTNDVSDMPIAGAHILVFPDLVFIDDQGIVPPAPVAEAWTNLAGEYAITKIPAGEYRVECTASRFLPAVQSVKVEAGQRTQADFALTPDNQPTTQKVFGFVTAFSTDPTFAPVFIPGAVIELISNWPGRPPVKLYRGVSSATGYYEIPNVDSGPYNAVASATGYQPLTLPITVMMGRNLRVDFSLLEAVKIDAVKAVLASEESSLNTARYTPPAYGAIAGTVTEVTSSDQNPGAPVAGAYLTLVPLPRGGRHTGPQDSSDSTNDFAGALLEDMGVSHNLLTVTSAADGSYSFPKVRTGNWGIITRANGYFSDFRSTSVEADATTTVDIALRPQPVPGKGTIQGNVWDATGTTPIADAVILLLPVGHPRNGWENDNFPQLPAVQDLEYGKIRTNDNGSSNDRLGRKFLRTTTDVNGFYQFEEVLEGRYLVFVIAKGFRPANAFVTLSAGDVLVQDFNLRQRRFGPHDPYESPDPRHYTGDDGEHRSNPGENQGSSRGRRQR